ncbi:MAG: hypothetical protein GY795_24545 [Desulfobacterales bacterium]|nr:hypothetical protein [Desulfobacterales bacterium]
MKIRPYTARALGLPEEPEPSDEHGGHVAGNVAAHLVRLVEGGGEGLHGIGLGWADQEASTSYLTAIVATIDEHDGDELAEYDPHEGDADSVTPVYNGEIVDTAREMHAYLEPVDTGIAADEHGDIDFTRVAQIQLYEWAAAALDKLAEAIGEAADDDE